MDKIKILVAQHKEAEVYSNNVYTPIQVGKALSKVDLGILGDNTGDNISKLNPYFCELTAQYWAWKNMKDVEYIGLCHYRRYFKTVFTEENVEKVMDGADIVLAKRCYMTNNILYKFHYEHLPEEATLFCLYMTKRFPDELSYFERFFKLQNWICPANMFVCKKSLFDDFCKWQFDILFDLYKLIPVTPHQRNNRLMGYFAEALLPYYAFKQKLKVKEMPLVSTQGAYEMQESFIDFIKKQMHFTRSKHKYELKSDVMLGLQANGYIEKLNDMLKNK